MDGQKDGLIRKGRKNKRTIKIEKRTKQQTGIELPPGPRDDQGEIGRRRNKKCVNQKACPDGDRE